MWSKQQVAVVISFIVTNCFIQISCNIIGNTSSVELIDNIVVSDSNNNHDKSKKFIEVETTSTLSESQEGSQTNEEFVCSCESDDEDCFFRCLTADDKSDGFDNMFLLTAGEVLLGTAIIMGLSALVTLLLRACTRRRMPRNGRDIPDLLDALERNENRASLTSLQRTVISKLRDRPPRYETRHNYEYRQREGINRNENLNLQQNNQEASDRRLIAVLNPSANRRNEPPPPYEPVEDSHSIHELPPAYTIRLSIHDETTFRSGEDLLESVCRGTNPSPLCSNNQEQEQEGQNERRNEALENNIVEHDTRPNIISNRTCDSILYI